MFKVGEAVIHPNKGAGVITDIKRMPKLKQNQRFYKIKMFGYAEKTTLMVPIKQAEKIGMRSAITEKKVDQIWEILSTYPMGLPARHKKRYRILQDKLDTGQVQQIAEIVRDIRWRLMQIKKLNIPGERIYKKAKRFLVGELAVAQDVDVETAEAQVDRLLTEKLPDYMAH
ncbi:MAG: CarD family transcriptional regulator [Anaerolineae bacterium]|nr:CarD family transcriptional regulator [Anaerolineae bacterium]